MRKRGIGVGVPAIAGWLWMMGEASAAPKLRAQVTQHGDFEWIGDTLGQHCGAVVKPIVGTVGACGPPSVRGAKSCHSSGLLHCAICVKERCRRR